MSDGTNTEGQETTGNEKYVSQIDDLFAFAYNSVHNPEDAAKAGEGGTSDSAAGAGAEGAATSGEGAAAATGDGTAQDAGAVSTTAGDQPGADGGAAATDAGTGKADGDPGAGGDGGAESDSAGVATEGLESADAVALFAPARDKAFQQMDLSFRQAAIAELQEEIEPEVLEILQDVPARLAGQEVPSLARDAKPGDRIRLNDSRDAAQYQKDLSSIVEKMVKDRTAEKSNDARPMASVIQESFLLFENNPDLIPNTKGFDKELATRFVEIAAPYATKINGKTIGYAVNVQPLINSLRADIAKQRGANGVTAAQQRAEQQRQAAAAQERDAEGKFQPQAGVLSKSGNQGEAADDYSAFWGASGVPMPGTLGI
ncbi:hypothetical protein SEA_UNPHAZED_50 [Microbacterium phage Unphazed]|uniref:Uncharacterized protein n=2 Tax=Tinytimothyvirus alex44 TaxID=2845588 RepID=A0A7G9A0I4_9CAUD|nr:hypothetical protein HWC34_gp50 [Microbacterium phage Alex44]QJD52794.1 hypothetical protein SEA_UNPHAZED_50 [Microbacterium phage Unphazed]QNL30123.1 hypothetical protein SEA_STORMBREAKER_50 [Microbacterium phage Stormbreaker]UTN92914.1 hypothetical protein SEA_BIRDFEEDER_48 [Microbacterium phage Birdfeeder]WNM73260.1 hypothetical protein SEA_DUMPQUIST_49 [Microbacterium phage DumpQuist]QDF15960.1 hypothetical protein SEA_ALEX44_50 [Microbacterium phage Alex44]